MLLIKNKAKQFKDKLTNKIMFSEEEFESSFPKFELCYELLTHKKVLDSNVMLAIPEGKRCFAWFTSYLNQNACLLLELDDNNHIIKKEIIVTSFSNKLAYGTVLYGTLFNTTISSNKCFCIEDIYFCYGENVSTLSYLAKLEHIRDICSSHLSQHALTNKFVIFGLPLMTNNFEKILEDVQILPYKVAKIKFRYFNRKKIYVMNYFKPRRQDVKSNAQQQAKRRVFKVTADIEPDIYNLFAMKGGTETYFDVSFIPDYNTSVMMNKLFRNIKENENLDAIEESDSEEEFQDFREDKYVYLDRAFNIVCEYNSRFNKWKPICLAKDDETVAAFDDVFCAKPIYTQKSMSKYKHNHKHRTTIK